MARKMMSFPLLCTLICKKTLLSKSSMASSSSSSWTCNVCTFINPSSQKGTCLICLSSSSASSSSSSAPISPRWSCKSCTFLNPYDKSNCQVCGTRSSPFSLLSTVVDDDLDDPSIGSVFLPLKPCKRKSHDSPEQLAAADHSVGKDSSKPLKIMSYNVWFREDLELESRMRALGTLIRRHSPDFICFQEVTPDIYEIFQKSIWWKAYSCSVSTQMAMTRGYFCMQMSKLTVKSYNQTPFHNSIMGRELCIAKLEIQPNLPLLIATSHLESPCPGPPKWDQMYSKERVQQAKEAMNVLKENPNVIFCGDMNWEDKLDGRFPFPDDKWFDAWELLRPGENGWTYDTKTNKMLSGNRTLQRRLDRFVCCFKDFDVSGIEMIGLEALPGLSYLKEKKVKGEVQHIELPVLPSDHYGLVLTVNTK